MQSVFSTLGLGLVNESLLKVLAANSVIVALAFNKSVYMYIQMIINYTFWWSSRNGTVIASRIR